MSARDPIATDAAPSAVSTFTATRSTPGGHPVVSLGIVLTLVLVVCQTLTQAIDFGVFQMRIGLLNSDTHASIFGVASLAAQGLTALAAAAITRLIVDERRP